MNHNLYIVTGSHTTMVHYAYAREGMEKSTFFAGCDRTDVDYRGDARMLAENNGDRDGLSFIVMQSFEDEADAHNARNEWRARDVDAIVGPSVFPADVHARAIGKRSYKLSRSKTAREAWAVGLFTGEQIAAAAAKHGRDTILKALDQMAPSNFEQLYVD